LKANRKSEVAQEIKKERDGRFSLTEQGITRYSEKVVSGSRKRPKENTSFEDAGLKSGNPEKRRSGGERSGL
jgi:hypothetical protein